MVRYVQILLLGVHIISGQVCHDMTPQTPDLVRPNMTPRSPHVHLAEYRQVSLDLFPRSPYLTGYGQVCQDLTPRSPDLVSSVQI